MVLGLLPCVTDSLFWSFQFCVLLYSLFLKFAFQVLFQNFGFICFVGYICYL